MFPVYDVRCRWDISNFDSVLGSFKRDWVGAPQLRRGGKGLGADLIRSCGNSGTIPSRVRWRLLSGDIVPTRWTKMHVRKSPYLFDRYHVLLLEHGIWDVVRQGLGPLQLLPR